MRLFNVHNTETYGKFTANFKQQVLDKSIQDINKFTEFEVEYSEIKVGNQIKAFHITWRKGSTYYILSERQQKTLEKYIEVITNDVNRIINNPLYVKIRRNRNRNRNREKEAQIFEDLSLYRERIMVKKYTIRTDEFDDYLEKLKILFEQAQNWIVEEERHCEVLYQNLMKKL